MVFENPKPQCDRKHFEQMPHIHLDSVREHHFAIIADSINLARVNLLTAGERTAYLKQKRLLLASTKVASSAVKAQIMVDTTWCSSDWNR